jgi:hypothetical protein
VAFSTSALDTLSSASLSARVARSSASLTRRAMLSHAATASQTEVSAVRILNRIFLTTLMYFELIFRVGQNLCQQIAPRGPDAANLCWRI